MYTRTCPECSKEITYKRKAALKLAIKNGRPCLSCVRKGNKNAKGNKSQTGLTRTIEQRKKMSIAQGGNGSLDEGRYDKREYHKWSRDVKRRDKCCQICGSTKKLHAHHIIPKAKWLSGAYLFWNGITLCGPCHTYEHQLNSMNCFKFID